MNLSPHFTLAELTVSQMAARRGLANVPGPKAVAALTLLCLHVLEPVRLHFGCPVAVSSGYRAPEVNAAVGGSRTSQHCFGQAADFTVPGVHNLDVCQWILRNLTYDQLIYEFGRTGWVHVSWVEARLRNEELSAVRVSGRTRYLPGIVA